MNKILNKNCFLKFIVIFLLCLWGQQQGAFLFSCCRKPRKQGNNLEHMQVTWGKNRAYIRNVDFYLRSSEFPGGDLAFVTEFPELVEEVIEYASSEEGAQWNGFTKEALFEEVEGRYPLFRNVLQNYWCDYLKIRMKDVEGIKERYNRISSTIGLQSKN